MIIELFYGNGYVKYLIGCKVYVNSSVEDREKNHFKAKYFGPHLLTLNCVQTPVGLSFGYRKSLEWIKRMRNVIIYDFRQVHLEPVKNAILLPVKTFD